jgi:hypothetical protein
MSIQRPRMQLITPGMDRDVARALTQLQENFDRLLIDVSNLRDGRMYGHISSTVAPTWGTNAAGDLVRNSAPTEVTATAGDNYVVWGWVCTVSGSPGTWEELRIPTGTVTTGWDDLRFPVQSINLSGATAPPSTETDTAKVPGSLLFSGTLDNSVTIIAQMPHRWKRGTVIRPHIHWCKPTGSSNTVVWQLTYRIIGNPDEAPGAWSSPITGTLVAGTQTTSDNNLLTSFGDIAMTDKEESAIVAFVLTRAAQSSGSDNDTNAVRLYEFDIHYQSDKPLGTTDEIPSP